MSLKLQFNDVSEIAPRIWMASIEPSDLRDISGNKVKTGSKSVVALRRPNYSSSDNSLSVALKNVEPLIIGDTNTTILVDQSSKEVIPEPTPIPPGVVGAGISDPKGRGISGFLQACEDEDMPRDVTEAVKQLLLQIERQIDFSLTEGKNRKWTADPNFVAITIQNTNKEFLISVKGNYRNLQHYRSIRPHQGRGIAYSEFKFSKRKQINDAFDIILKSAGR